jgi:hypothetical protein
VLRFSAPVRTGPGAHPASCTMGTGSFPGVKRPGRGAEHPPLLVPRSRKSRAVPLHPLWAFGSVTGNLSYNTRYLMLWLHCFWRFSSSAVCQCHRQDVVPSFSRVNESEDDMLKMKSLPSFKTSAASYLLAERHIPEVLKYFTWNVLCLYTGWSKSLCAPDDYSTKKQAKIF